MHKFIITLGLCLLFIQVQAQEDPSKDPSAAAKKPAKAKSFSDIIPADAVTDAGLFTIHRVGQKYFFEVPKVILGRDILVASVISGHVKGLNFGGAGMRSRPQQIVRWYMQDDKILLKSVTYDAIADPSLPVAKAVQRNNFEPIIMVFDLATMSKDSSAVVFDATGLFTSDIPMIGPLTKAEKRTFEIQALDAKRSYVTSMKSYPQNTEVRHVLTFTGTNIPDNQLTNTLSIEMNQSFILLPEKIWQPRFLDERVGYFSLTRTNYGLDEQKAANQTLITRWRLEPKDPAAYFRGELVEPVKPIVYYIDPGTPMEWRPFLKKGIEDWQAAFETAGFKNAIIAKDPPTPEEDPEWSPEDVRYSVIRYITTDIQNAVGPHVHDPRSGEIIESDILWYHNVMNLLRNWFFIQTAAANPEARTPKFKQELMGELIRFVAAHEVGHTLGLPHNMGSSSAYSVDSLRAPGFVQRMGVAPSIMDYARFNYVAQPQDKGAGFYAAVGPYDKWSIEWGYRLIKDTSDPEKEKPTLNTWILNKAGNPIYRYGQQQFNTIDPSGQTEDIGDDAIKASDLGIENLKVTTSKLIEWTVKPGEDFAEHWSYRSIIGKLNFLEKSTRPDIAYAVHQCARFSANPKASHAVAVRNIVRYLIGTPAQGIVLQPNEHSFVVWADADFCGNWNRDTSVSDTMTAKSRSGYAITYASCPVLWASKLQTEVALSTTEAEYVCLSQSLRDTIPLMNLLAEVRDKLDKDVISVPAVRCTLFEDNSGALELARTPKMRPRTKHINIKYHHFRDHVRRKLISIEHVATEDQVADIFTKPLPVVAFLRHRKSLQCW